MAISYRCASIPAAGLAPRVGPAGFPTRKGHFPAGPPLSNGKGKDTLNLPGKNRVKQVLDDKIVQPVKNATVLAIAAFITAVFALIVAVAR